jgi:putative ABC transport system permease protein
MDTLIHDLKVGARLLWKDRGFTATVAVTLALCIGANVALFSIVSNVLLRPLPMPDSERIAIIGNSYPKAGAANLRANAVPDYFDRLRETTAFQEQAFYNNASVNIDQNGAATRVRAMNVTPSFFRVLGVQPLLGRTFTEAEGEPGNQLKIVLSYGLWQSAFGGDAAIVGRDVRIDGTTYTVVGVMPQPFVYQRPDVMLWRALAFTPIQKSDQSRHSNNFQQIGRLKPGATVEQAQAEIDRLNAHNLERFPQFKEVVINAGFNTIVARLQDDMVREVRTTLYLLWGGALFVLLIGCVNVANLVLVRSRARLKELATRLALGAPRARIARQLITEGLMLALVSSALGLAVGWGALRLLGALNIQELPRGSEIRLDLAVVAATLAAGTVIGVVLGLIPSAAVRPSTVTTMLREEGRSGTSGRGARLLRRGLVVAQVAFAFVLLAGAVLLFSSFQRVLSVDPGFKADHVFTGTVVLPRSRFRENSAMVAFLNESLQRIRALPGVVAAGTTGLMPLSGNSSNSVIFAEGYQMKPGDSAIAPTNASVSPGFFEAMGVQLMAGRFFDERDAEPPGAAPNAFGLNQPRVAIVDDRLARRFWPGQDPIGRRMYLPTDPNNLTAVTPQTVFIDVVGVIKEMKLQSLTQQDEFVGAVYFPVLQTMPPAQAAGLGLNYAIKTASDPGALGGALRQTIASLDRELALFDVLTMSERVDRSLVNRRSPVVLSLTFGAIALLLSAIGIYGVLAYVVTQRRREIGIRLALGSSGRRIFDLILREGLILIAAGFALGAVGAIALRRSLQSQLFQISATDPVALTAAAAVLALVAVAACALPARRATRIDPVIALAE